MPSLHIMHLILKRTIWNEYYHLLFKVEVSEITKLRLTKSPKVTQLVCGIYQQNLFDSMFPSKAHFVQVSR